MPCSGFLLFNIENMQLKQWLQWRSCEEPEIVW